MCLLFIFVALLANGDNEHLALSLYGDIYLVDFFNERPSGAISCRSAETVFTYCNQIWRNSCPVSLFNLLKNIMIYFLAWNLLYSCSCSFTCL